MFNAKEIVKHVAQHGDEYLLHLKVQKAHNQVCVKHVEMVVSKSGDLDFDMTVYWSSPEGIRIPMLTRVEDLGAKTAADAHINDVQDTLRAAGFSNKAAAKVRRAARATMAPCYYAQAVAGEVREAMSRFHAQA